MTTIVKYVSNKNDQMGDAVLVLNDIIHFDMYKYFVIKVRKSFLNAWIN